MTDTNKAQGEKQQDKPKAVRRLGEDYYLTEKTDNRGRLCVFIPGTLRFVTADMIELDVSLAPYLGKQIVTKICEGEYEDGVEAPTFTVATSDLHQCFYAEHNGMRKTMRNKRNAERRAAAKKKREDDAAELAAFKGAEAQSA